MEVVTEFYIEREDDEFDVYIVGDAEPSYAPNFSGHPDNWHPGGGGSVCVEAIFLDEALTMRWIGELTGEEERIAEECLMEQLEEDLRDAAEAAAEAKADARRDDYRCFGRYGRVIY